MTRLSHASRQSGVAVLLLGPNATPPPHHLLLLRGEYHAGLQDVSNVRDALVHTEPGLSHVTPHLIRS